MDLELSQPQRDLQATAQRLAEDELRPHAARWDEQEEFPERSLEAMAGSGLLGLTVPTAFGGQGAGVLEACLVLEEFARGCLASAVVAQMFLNGPPRAIATLGTPDQQQRYLPEVAAGRAYWGVAMTEPQAGSAGTELTTTLSRDGDRFRLDGQKWAITGGARAEHFLVFCRAEGTSGPKGIGAVVVHRDAEGFAEPEIEPKMGSRGVAEASLRFDGVAISPDEVILTPDPESKQGARMLLQQFNPERCGNAAMCIGVAQAALDDSVSFTAEREQFGQPIAAFQGTQWRLADMAVDIEAARLLLWRAALTDEGGFPRTRETAMAKLVAGEMSQRVTNAAIQLHGHRGYTRTRPIERYFRDVRGMALGGGTAEIMRNLIGAEVSGVRVSQRASR